MRPQGPRLRRVRAYSCRSYNALAATHRRCICERVRHTGCSTNPADRRPLSSHRERRGPRTRTGGSVAVPDQRFEQEVQKLAREIAAAGASERAHLFHLGRWSERVLDWAMAHPGLQDPALPLRRRLPGLPRRRRRVAASAGVLRGGRRATRARRRPRRSPSTCRSAPRSRRPRRAAMCCAWRASSSPARLPPTRCRVSGASGAPARRRPSTCSANERSRRAEADALRRCVSRRCWTRWPPTPADWPAQPQLERDPGARCRASTSRSSRPR